MDYGGEEVGAPEMMRVVPVLGTAQQRIRALATPADVYVVNRENVQWLVEHFKMRGRLTWWCWMKVPVSRTPRASGSNP